MSPAAEPNSRLAHHRRLRALMAAAGYPDPDTIRQERTIWHAASGQIPNNRVCSTSSVGMVTMSSPEMWVSHESVVCCGRATMVGVDRRSGPVASGQAGTACRSLSRLCTVQIRRHSLCTPAWPRRVNLRNPRLALMLPKTGSMLTPRLR